MYDSDLSDWNAARMGPKRDVVGELKRATEKEGIAFGVSSHGAENFWFYGGGREFDSGIQDTLFQEPYGFADPVYGVDNSQSETSNIYSTPPSKEHLDDWLARACELVDKYHPKVVWFDWWIHKMDHQASRSRLVRSTGATIADGRVSGQIVAIRSC